MIVSKTFLIVGEVKTYNGKAVRTIGEVKDKLLNEFFKKNKGIEVKDIETNIQFGGQDQALVTVLYEDEKESKK